MNGDNLGFGDGFESVRGFVEIDNVYCKGDVRVYEILLQGNISGGRKRLVSFNTQVNVAIFAVFAGGSGAVNKDMFIVKFRILEENGFDGGEGLGIHEASIANIYDDLTFIVYSLYLTINYEYKHKAKDNRFC